MTLQIPKLINLKKGDSCREEFKKVYENRYTWPISFPGYNGSVKFINSTHEEIGTFIIDSDFKSEINGILDNEIKKNIINQLWEVTIHRVRRDFDEVHKDNIFKVVENSEDEIEIFVEGRNKGDRYRIKDGFVSMVYRKVHGKIVKINTKKIIDTGNGYLSNSYTSEYKDIKLGTTIGSILSYEDTFVPLSEEGYWVLEKRIIKENNEDSSFQQIYEFTDMKIN